MPFVPIDLAPALHRAVLQVPVPAAPVPSAGPAPNGRQVARRLHPPVRRVPGWRRATAVRRTRRCGWNRRILPSIGPMALTSRCKLRRTRPTLWNRSGIPISAARSFSVSLIATQPRNGKRRCISTTASPCGAAAGAVTVSAISACG